SATHCETENTIAGFIVKDFMSDLDDFSGEVLPERHGKSRNILEFPRSDLPVQGVHSRIVDLDENMSISNFGKRGFLEFQLVGRAVLVDADGFHEAKLLHRRPEKASFHKAATDVP